MLSYFFNVGLARGNLLRVLCFYLQTFWFGRWESAGGIADSVLCSVDRSWIR